MARKVRQCPHCKSKKGFSISVVLGGYHDYTMSFSGKILDEKREGSDSMESYGACLECKKPIDVEFLDVQKV
jgi:hypothetical protein